MPRRAARGGEKGCLAVLLASRPRLVESELTVNGGTYAVPTFPIVCLLECLLDLPARDRFGLTLEVVENPGEDYAVVGTADGGALRLQEGQPHAAFRPVPSEAVLKRRVCFGLAMLTFELDDSGPIAAPCEPRLPDRLQIRGATHLNALMTRVLHE